MFTITVHLKTGPKRSVAAGARRALWQLREYRATYGVEPVVSDDSRTYTEAELQEMIDGRRP